MISTGMEEKLAVIQLKQQQLFHLILKLNLAMSIILIFCLRYVRIINVLSNYLQPRNNKIHLLLLNFGAYNINNSLFFS
jgi:hypothetical protein